MNTTYTSKNNSMLNTPESINLLTEFNHILKNVDRNISQLEQYSEINPSLLKETNQMICSASLILAKMHDKKESTAIITKEYYNLERRKNTLSSINNKFQMDALQKYNNSPYNNMPNTQDKTEGMVDIGLTTDYNEKLLQGSMHNLYEVNNNLNIVAHNLKDQGEQLEDTNNRLIGGNEKNKETGKILNEINRKQKCQKYSMFVANILLFSVIVLLLVIRIINYFKY